MYMQLFIAIKSSFFLGKKKLPINLHKSGPTSYKSAYIYIETETETETEIERQTERDVFY